MARTAAASSRLADQGNRVDRDALAADVVTVRFGDGPERHLADLGPAAHDDDALAVNLGQRRRLLERHHALRLAQFVENPRHLSLGAVNSK